MRNAIKTNHKTRQMTVTTPLGASNRRQLWAMGFMSRGLLVCTPALPGMHEQPPAARHGEPANNNYRLAIVG